MIYHGSLDERFWVNVDKGDPDECWLWLGARMTRGYGQILTESRRKGRYLVGAHRVSWELHNGPIPDGFEVCHRCDNPPCVNPIHLFVGTHLENMQDRDSKKSAGRY